MKLFFDAVKLQNAAVIRFFLFSREAAQPDGQLRLDPDERAAAVADEAGNVVGREVRLRQRLRQGTNSHLGPHRGFQVFLAVLYTSTTVSTG